MPTLSLESLLMMTSTLLASWSVDINRAFEVCCDNLRAVILPWLMISPRTLLFAPTDTSAAFGAKLDFPPGSIGSLTIVSEKTRGNERNWSELMRGNGNPSWIRKRSTPVSGMILCTR